MQETLQQHCLMLDLVDNPVLIEEYEQHHRAIWPEVIRHLKAAGIREMTIHRLGNRMVMVVETDTGFSFEKLAAAERGNPVIQRWEQLMWRYQQATPWTPEGEKWISMQRIFSLSAA